MNKEKQVQILRHFADCYPATLDVQRGLIGLDQAELAGYVRYLEQHRLLTMKWSAAIGAPNRPLWGTITAAGLDYLNDDGGLTSELNVLTVRLHEDSIRSLILDRIAKSDAEPDVKNKLKEQVAALPAEGLKTIVVEGLKAGLAKTPDIASWLQKWL